MLPGFCGRRMLMDISTFLSKVGTEYPILLTAELLVLVTLALVAALFRRLLRPFVARYFHSYRDRQISHCNGKIKILEDALNNDQNRMIEMTRSGILAVIYATFFFGTSVFTLIILLLRGEHLADFQKA
jgi:hypothetical protein